LKRVPVEFGVRRLPRVASGRYPVSASVVSGIAVGIDSLAIVGTGIALYFQFVSFDAESLSIYMAAICSIWITSLMLFQFSELYRFEAIVRPLSNIDKFVISFATGILLLLAAAFALKVSATFSRLWVGTFGIAAVFVTIGARLIVSWVVLQLSRLGVFSRNVIIVGRKRHVSRLLERVSRVRPEFVLVTALFVDHPSDPAIGETPVKGGFADIPEFVRTDQVDDVVIALPWSAEREILALLNQLRELPVNVYLGSDLIGLKLDFREPPDHFSGMPMVSVFGHPMSGWAIAIKTVEDYVLGVMFLIIGALPMAAIALLIRLNSAGPALFRQKRFGFNNREFWIYKFRTMQHEPSPQGKTVQATKDDPRVTMIGRLLRRTSLDELPQLFNVLNGTMSLVGPRPHAVDHNEEYSQLIRGYFARHRVKPGMTGWAQVNGFRGETDAPEKMEARVRYDVYYAENWSLLFDLRILFQTLVVLLTGRNAY